MQCVATFIKDFATMIGRPLTDEPQPKGQEAHS